MKNKIGLEEFFLNLFKSSGGGDAFYSLNDLVFRSGGRERKDVIVALGNLQKENLISIKKQRGQVTSDGFYIALVVQNSAVGLELSDDEVDQLIRLGVCNSFIHSCLMINAEKWAALNVRDVQEVILGEWNRRTKKLNLAESIMGPNWEPNLNGLAPLLSISIYKNNDFLEHLFEFRISNEGSFGVKKVWDLVFYDYCLMKKAQAEGVKKKWMPSQIPSDWKPDVLITSQLERHQSAAIVKQLLLEFRLLELDRRRFAMDWDKEFIKFVKKKSLIK